MAWSEKKELTEGQKRAAEFAGIPADRPGLLAEYPKAVYKDDEAGDDRRHLGEPILVDGKFAVRTATVADEVEEIEALEQGWRLTADPAAEQKRKDAVQSLEAENAALRARLASSDEMAGVRPAKRTVTA